MKLENARVLVTGGSEGIGRATAALLVERGARVVICGRDATKLAATARAIGAHAVACDVADEAAVEALVAGALTHLGGLDALINNAGFGRFGGLLETSSADFEAMWRTNTLGAFQVGRACARHFVASRGGSIVNVGSTAARRGFARGSAYCGSKFALSGLTECWRAELRGHGVRVMQVDPSEVQTDFGASRGTKSAAQLDPRKLVARDIAQAIVALLELDERAFTPSIEVWATNPR